ncbi:hypothetical protein D3C80_1329460 [compost metagenome]
MRVHHVPGHQAPAEQHRKKDQKGEYAAVFEVRPGNRIRIQRRNKYTQQCTDHCDKNGHPIGFYNDGIVLEDIGIRLQAELLREKLIPVQDNRIVIGNGDHEDQYNRQQAGDRQDDKYKMEQRIRELGDFIIGHSISLLLILLFSENSLVLVDLAHDPVRAQYQEKSDQ